MLAPQLEPRETPSLLTAQQLAKLLQVSTRTIWRLRSAGQLPQPIELGGSIRWNRDAVHRWINAGCPPQESGRGR